MTPQEIELLYTGLALAVTPLAAVGYLLVTFIARRNRSKQ